MGSNGRHCSGHIGSDFFSLYLSQFEAGVFKCWHLVIAQASRWHLNPQESAAPWCFHVLAVGHVNSWLPCKVQEVARSLCGLFVQRLCEAEAEAERVPQHLPAELPSALNLFAVVLWARVPSVTLANPQYPWITLLTILPVFDKLEKWLRERLNKLKPLALYMYKQKLFLALKEPPFVSINQY